MYNFQDLSESENIRVQELAEKIQRENVYQNASQLVYTIRTHVFTGYMYGAEEEFYDSLRKSPEDLWREILEQDGREPFVIVASEIDEDFVKYDEALSDLDTDALEALANLYDHVVDDDEMLIGLTPQQMLEKVREDYDNPELCSELGIVPEHDFDPDEESSEVYELASAMGIEEYHEVLEWWAVSHWMSERLQEADHPVWTFDGFNFWGRCATGQSMLLDGVFQSIARDMLEKDFEREREAARLEQEARESAAPSYGQELLQVLADSQ